MDNHDQDHDDLPSTFDFLAVIDPTEHYDEQTAACVELAIKVLRFAVRDYLRGPHVPTNLEDYESARDFFAEYDDASEPMSFFWICHAISPLRPKWLRWHILHRLGCCPVGLDQAD